MRTAATGTAEREAAVEMMTVSAPPKSTIGGDKAFDQRGFPGSASSGIAAACWSIGS